MPTHAKIIAVAGSRSRMRELARTLRFAGPVDTASSVRDDRPWERYRLIVSQANGSVARARPVLARLNPRAHVVLIGDQVEPSVVVAEMADVRVNHFIASTQPLDDLAVVARKLSSGAIFGLSRHMGKDGSGPLYCRMASYRERSAALKGLESSLQAKRLRGSVRRAALRVAEELLMNAMYQAPVDENGEKVFACVDARRRVRRRSPKMVSLRYAVKGRGVYLSVRDRYGSLRRNDLIAYLVRRGSGPTTIEDKPLGAGLGLQSVASSVSRLIVNVLPHAVTEVICAIDPPEPLENGLSVFSLAVQRPQPQGAGED